MAKNAHKGSSPVAAQSGRPPVVAVLGHVDHGKTTLLDTIRKTNVASREHGGITQHIGAYQIVYQAKNAAARTITFIDTPGHEAFKNVRSRGANAADIAILVVAANDSVKPQTKESIEQINAAGIPMIVAINKIDIPGVIVEKVKSDLAKVGVQVEGFGGDVPFVEVSAKEGTGVDALLSLITLVYDMKAVKEESKDARAVVIEAKVDKFRGQVATMLVKSGAFSVGDALFDGQTVLGKVRAMMDENGKRVPVASAGKPVEVLGFSTLPVVGSLLGNEAFEAKKAVKEEAKGPLNAEDFLAAMTKAEKKRLKLYIKADTSGSLEAVVDALPKDGIDVVRADLGDVTEADVLEAKAMGAFVIGFNVKSSAPVEKLAYHEKVVIRIYTIIYELLEEMGEVVDGMEQLLSRERELGQATIVAEFPFDKTRIAGVKIVSGRMARGDTVRVKRGEEVIGQARIKSIRQGKNEVTKAETGKECGILFDKPLDFLPQDGIIAFTTG